MSGRSACRTRRAGALVAALLALLSARRGSATPFFLESFDAVDCATYTTSCDSLRWGGETDVAASEETDLGIARQNNSSGHVHNAENGADGTSAGALRLDFASTEGRYYTLPWAKSFVLDTISACFRLHLPSAPSAEAAVLRFRESDGTDGGGLAIAATGALVLKYNATTIGTTTQLISPKACWLATDTTSATPCTSAATDCPANYTCGCDGSAPACDTPGTVDASSGRGAAWVGVCVTQENITDNRARMTLRVNGRKLLSGEVVANPVPAVTNLRLGRMTTSGTLTAFVDDFVLDDSANPGNAGWLGAAYPTASLSAGGQWTPDSCNTGSTCAGDPAASVHWGCINELACGVYNAGSGDFLNSGTAAGRAEAWRFGALLAPPSGVGVPAIEHVWLGRASSTSSDTRAVTEQLGLCESTASCGVPVWGTGSNVTVANDVTDRTLSGLIATTTPGGTPAAWSAATLGRIAYRVTTRSTNTERSRATAAMLVGYYLRPTERTPSLLREHNRGTNNDRRTIAAVGHSNTGGTVGGRCSGGTAPFGTTCNQTDFASWDAAEKDSPVGGCNQDHAAVRTCTLRRAEANATAGYQCGTCTCASGTSCTGVNITAGCPNGGTCSKTCATGTAVGAACTTDGDCAGSGKCLGVCTTAASECPTSGGTCTGDATANDGVKDGTCTQNPNIPCDDTATDPDCNNLGGSCATDATCVLACGEGGVCTGTGGYSGIAASQIPADTFLICAQGAEGSNELLVNRWERILQGIEPTCYEAVGFPGACQCTVNGDCPGGGTCTSGLCVGGSGCVGYASGAYECKTCSTSADCGTGGTCLSLASGNYCACQFDPPDVLLVHTTAADIVKAGQAPTCAEPEVGTAVVTGLCDGNACPINSAADFCLSDTEAQAASRTPPAGSPSARCLGASGAAGAGGRMCLGGSVLGECTASVTACRNTTDCPAFGGNQQTCTTSATDQATVTEGYCQCSSNAQCPADFACVNSVCRLACGRCSTTTTRRCSADAMCPGGETCGAPADTRCRVDGNGSAPTVCNTSSPYVCKGRATCPCDRATCSTDADCPVYTPTIKNRLTTFRGRCVTGRCTECGVLYGQCPDARFPQARANYRALTQNHRMGFLDFLALQDAVRAPTDTDGRPLMLAMTEPQHRGRDCTFFTDAEYLGKQSAHMLTASAARLPYVADVRSALARRPVEWVAGECFGGVTGAMYGQPIAVHYLGPQSSCLPKEATTNGQQIVADTVTDYLASLNACTVGSCRSASLTYGPACGSDAECSGFAGAWCEFKHGLPAPQRYCRSATGAWTGFADAGVTCASSETCTAAGATCQIRPCTCACTRTSECKAWYGDASACLDASNGACDGGEACTCKGAANPYTDACTTAFGAGYACDAASAKCLNSGADACPATGDGCNPE
jgi:hypothetical protein